MGLRILLFAFCLFAKCTMAEKAHRHPLGLTINNLRRQRGADKARDAKLVALGFIGDPIQNGFETSNFTGL